jgi:hypothetical protein
MFKRFFYACLGILCLALAYHLGANNANAQGSTGRVREIAASGDNAWVVTDTDDVYFISRNAASVSHGDGWAKYRLGVLH